MVSSISCPVCSNLCSSQAVACPKCGHPINQPKQNAEVENTSNSSQSSTGSILRKILWVFFAISFLYALGAIDILFSMPRSDGGYGDRVIFERKIAIAYHIAPLIIMIIILAITYSAKERS